MIARIRKLLRNVEQGLLLIVERALDDQGPRTSKPEPLLRKLKSTRDRESCRRQHNRVYTIQQSVLENGRNIDRCRLQVHSARPAFYPIDKRFLRSLHPETKTCDILFDAPM